MNVYKHASLSVSYKKAKQILSVIIKKKRSYAIYEIYGK